MDVMIKFSNFLEILHDSMVIASQPALLNPQTLKVSNRVIVSNTLFSGMDKALDNHSWLTLLAWFSFFCLVTNSLSLQARNQGLC